MHMIEQRIQQQFYDSADLQVQSAEALARPIAEAANTVLGAITAGGKVLAYGAGASATDAQRFVAAFIGTFERERPPLAALVLAGDHAFQQALQTTAGTSPNPSPISGSVGVALKQLQALSAPGDVLLLIAADATTPGLVALVQAAHDKDMAVVALCGRVAASDADAAQAPTLSRAMAETDVLIAVPHTRTARVLELHALVLHCLCDAVDLQLMGEQELT
jgi:D-sedoheptulose 7-phosphate isomerase